MLEFPPRVDGHTCLTFLSPSVGILPYDSVWCDTACETRRTSIERKSPRGKSSHSLSNQGRRAYSSGVDCHNHSRRTAHVSISKWSRVVPTLHVHKVQTIVVSVLSMFRLFSPSTNKSMSIQFPSLPAWRPLVATSFITDISDVITIVVRAVFYYIRHARTYGAPSKHHQNLSMQTIGHGPVSALAPFRKAIPFQAPRGSVA